MHLFEYTLLLALMVLVPVQSKCHPHTLLTRR